MTEYRYWKWTNNKVGDNILKSQRQQKKEEIEDVVEEAEKKEENSNQIIGFTREIKKYPIEFRLKVIEIIWKIVYSDGKTDNFESNLIRRICGLLYVTDKDNGIIKNKIVNQLKNI